MVVTEEFYAGLSGASTLSYVMSLLHPRVIRDLELRDLGLTVLPANDMFCPLGRDDYLIFSGDVARTAQQFGRFSKRDGEVYPQFDAWLFEAADIVRRLLLDTPVDPTRRDLKGMRETFSLLWKYRKIGKRFYRLVDLMTMSADDFLSRWFEHSVTRAALAYYCSIGTFTGPKTPGSAYVVLHHLMGEHEGRRWLGLCPWRHGRHQRCDCCQRAPPWHGNSHQCRCDPNRCERWPRCQRGHQPMAMNTVHAL